jgi:glycosyltransferase involved in cell wall biosynthesis
MKIALVHDWLTGMRGGEKVLEVFCELFPDAHLYTLLHNKGSLSSVIEDMDIRTSFIQKLPFVKKKYRHFLPIFPTAIERFDLREYDLVLSSSHCVAKGVVTSADTLHICYCFTPMRYIWDLYNLYFGKERAGMFTRLASSLVLNYLRKWDLASCSRVDKFVAISRYIAERIKKNYGRDSDLIYPPVDCSYFEPALSNKNFYLMVSPLAPNKRVDIAVEAFNTIGLPLIVIGSGQEEKKLEKMAGKNIKLMGWQSDEIVREHYANCKALIFPGVEDFGIVPLEAQACGKPVIAFGEGGALETIIPLDKRTENRNEQLGNATGLFFYEQTAESLANAVARFEDVQGQFNWQAIRRNAESFDRAIFKDRVRTYVDKEYREFRHDLQDK